MGEGIVEVFLKYWPIFLRGLGGTLEYAFIAVFFGSILGTLVAMAHLSKNKVLSAIAAVYVNVLRGTPLLVQMYISYYFLPMAFPALNKIDKVYFVLLALTLNSSAYVSEIFRSGIMSVDKGQTEAARSLGMTSGHCMRYIILPQAIKNILPAIANEFVVIIKESAITYTIGVQDIMSAVNAVKGATFIIMEPLLVATAIYFCLCFPTSKVIAYFERRMSRGDKR